MKANLVDIGALIASVAVALGVVTLALALRELVRLHQDEMALRQCYPLARLSDKQIREQVRLVQEGECEGFVYHWDEDRWEPL